MSKLTIRKLIWAISAMIVLILTVFVILVLTRAENAGRANSVVPVNPTQPQTSDLLTSTPRTNPQSVVDILNILISKAQALQKPGWLHIVTTNIGDNDIGKHGDINGVVLPLDFTQEIWLHIDDEGKVPESVSIEHRTDGSVVQAAVRKDGYVWNTMTGEYSAETPEASTSPYQPYLTSILRDVQRTDEYQRLELVEISFEGKDAYQLTIFYENSQPAKTFDFNQAVVKAEKTLVIDAETGLPIREQMIFTLDDGSRRELYRVDYSVHEYVDQPSIVAKTYLADFGVFQEKLKDYPLFPTPASK